MTDKAALIELLRHPPPDMVEAVAKSMLKTHLKAINWGSPEAIALNVEKHWWAWEMETNAVISTMADFLQRGEHGG